MAETDRRSSNAKGARNQGPSIYDAIRRPARRRGLRSTLALLRTAIGIVLRAGRKQFWMTAAAQVAGAAAVTLQLIIAESLLDAIVEGGDELSLAGHVGFLLAALVAATLVLGVSAGVQAELSLLLGEKVGRYASDQVLDVACTVDLDAFDRPGFYDRLQRARFSAGARNMAVARSVVGMLGAGLASAGVVVALAAVAPLLVPFALFVAVPLWMAAARNSRLFHEFTFSMTSSDRERNYLWNALTERDNAKEIRAYDIADHLRSRHDDLYDDRIERLRVLTRKRLRRTVIGTAAGSIFTGTTLLVLLLMVQQEWLTLGSAGAALLGSLVLGQRIRAALSNVAKLYESSLFIEDFTTFLELKPSTAEAMTEAPAAFERLVVEDVSFTYPEAPSSVLHGISLHIDRGEVVALVGENGSGKTTLAKLLAGLYLPDSGLIRWDEVDTASVEQRSLRQSVTIVFQDFVRWYLPARWNIGLGRVEEMEDEEGIRAAAGKAQAEEFISQLEHGYDTVLSRLFAGGTDLSLGQWQRVALARAFFRDSPFVIMDEPTASLDPLAEHNIFQTVREAMADQTLLLISHRFSSVDLADRIYVLSGGQIIEHGSHTELMALQGHYAQLFSLQAAAYLGSDVESA